MRKIQIILILGILMTGLAAAQPTDIASPGMSPDNPFYALDRASESLELAVAKAPIFGSEELEAKVRANHAEERLSEAIKMAERNNSEEAERLMEEYNQQSNRSAEIAKKLNNSELNQRMENISNKQVEVLNSVRDRVPDQAKAAIDRAIRNSQRNVQALKDRGKPDSIPSKQNENLEAPRQPAIRGEKGSVDTNRTTEEKTDKLEKDQRKSDLKNKTTLDNNPTEANDTTTSQNNLQNTENTQKDLKQAKPDTGSSNELVP